MTLNLTIFLCILSLFLHSPMNLDLNLVKSQDHENAWHLSHIEIEGAWELTMGSKDVIIAMIDSGIDFTHPDLANSSWINEDEIANNSIDDDNNGYIDDINGWDFVSNDNIPGPDDEDPINYHGTSGAGIIVAPIDGQGIAGIAPNVTLMDIRVLREDNYAGTTFGGFGDAIRYAVDNGADIINFSLQYYPDSPFYYDDILYAYEQGVVMVSITGNTWLPTGGQEIESLPGNYEEIICVGATNTQKEKADYSNYGDWIELVAPVGDEGLGLITTGKNDSYVASWGTSFACTQVSGVVALMKSLDNSISASTIRDILHRSSTDLGKKGYDIYFGYGLLNASMAVKAVLDPSILPEKAGPSGLTFTLIMTTSLILVSTIFSRRRRKMKKITQN